VGWALIPREDRDELFVIDQCQITSMTVGQPTITTYNYEILLNP